MSLLHLDEARSFLEDLAGNPPWFPYEPALVPALFAASKEGSLFSFDDISALIERSQKLTARVLSMANSALYALQSTVTSLPRAVSILGFREIRTLVLTLGAVSVIRDAKLPKSCDVRELWCHQVKTAVIARVLAKAASQGTGLPGGKPDDGLELTPDEAYVVGLLHDMGKVFLASRRPRIWDAIQALRKREGLDFHEAEYAYWGMDHALIGAQILHFWQLPPLLTDPINWHHAPALAPVFASGARLLAAANIIAHTGLDDNGALPPAAAALAPEGADSAVLGACVAKALAETAPETMAGLLD